jgi:hypothetical protein
MATLKELSIASGVQEIAPGRTIGEQVYDSSINTVSQDTNLGSDTYTGTIAPYSDNRDPFYSGLMQLTQPLRNTFNKYGPQIVGGLFSLASGIPGAGFLMNAIRPDPYAQNRIDMYGAYRGTDGFIKDKFGYNVGSTLMKSNYMEPGSNSFRSYALEGLRSLDQNLANDFYQENYGKTFDQVKSDIQNKENPFGPQPTNIGTSDYYGGNETNGGFNDSRGGGGGSFGDATNDASFSDYS